MKTKWRVRTKYIDYYVTEPYEIAKAWADSIGGTISPWTGVRPISQQTVASNIIR